MVKVNSRLFNKLGNAKAIQPVIEQSLSSAQQSFVAEELVSFISAIADIDGFIINDWIELNRPLASLGHGITFDADA